MLKILKKLGTKRIFAIVMLVFCAVIAMFGGNWFRQNVSAKPQQYVGVLEMWNVEEFEGGCGSRGSWLTRRASSYESRHKGLYVHVTTMSYLQAKEKLEHGETFDLVAFPCGSGYAFSDNIVSFGGHVGGFCEQYLQNATQNGNLYALPLWCGCYCLFARENQLKSANTILLPKNFSATLKRKVGKNTVTLKPIVVGESTFGYPLSALCCVGSHGTNGGTVVLSQYGAYQSFVANKTAITLLGTQRDLYRLSQRVQNGKMEKLVFSALGGYTDLVQYVAVGKSDGKKTAQAIQFVEYLTSEKCQSLLTELSLFSALRELSLYTDENYLQCENALKTAYVPNVFGVSDVTERKNNVLKEFCNE